MEGSHDIAARLAVSWTIGNQDFVAQELAELSAVKSAAVAIRIVLTLMDNPNVSIDLAMFTSRLEGEAHQEDTQKVKARFEKREKS
jgi:hypothetical protein